MIKYYNAMVVFEEIPDEITMAINITNCPCKCDGCHSKFLWGDIGVELTEKELDDIASKNSGITCVCFMGGDSDPDSINALAKHVKIFWGLNVGWYSGMDTLSDLVDISNFDYIKIGHYDNVLGPLNKKTTNQKMYKVVDGALEDITYRFWVKKHQ